MDAGNQQLLIAAKAGDEAGARRALAAGADQNAKDLRQCTPLHLAAFHNHATVVRLLIEHGADVNARDEEQRTPLQLAKANGHAYIAELLQTAIEQQKTEGPEPPPRDPSNLGRRKGDRPQQP